MFEFIGALVNGVTDLWKTITGYSISIADRKREQVNYLMDEFVVHGDYTLNDMINLNPRLYREAGKNKFVAAYKQAAALRNLNIERNEELKSNINTVIIFLIIALVVYYITLT